MQLMIVVVVSKFHSLRADADENEFKQILEALEGLILDLIARKYGVRARAYSRKELKEMLRASSHWDEGVWSEITGFFNQLDRLRFSGGEKPWERTQETQQLLAQSQRILDQFS